MSADFDFFTDDAGPSPKGRSPDVDRRQTAANDRPTDRPQRPTRRADADDSSSPPPRRGMSPLVIGGIALAGIVVVGGAAALLFAARGTVNDPDAKKKSVNTSAGGAAPAPAPKVPAKVESGDATTPSTDTIDKVKKATLRVLVAFKNGKTGSGSGFVEKSTGLVVTNAHVVGMLNEKDPGYEAINLVVNSGEGDTEYRLDGEVIDVDRDNDLALIFPRLLEVGGRTPVPNGLVVPRTAALTNTQKLFVFGFPLSDQLGPEIAVRPTQVVALRKHDNGKLRRIDVEGGMTFGNSGGPVIDVRGNVVGVAVAGMKDETIRFAVPGEKVLELLARKRK
jgi:S1-C subfamily serine protease